MNFNIRKTVLEYDDVLNKQREVIYAERRRVLEGEDLSERRGTGSPMSSWRRSTSSPVTGSTRWTGTSPGCWRACGPSTRPRCPPRTSHADPRASWPRARTCSIASKTTRSTRTAPGNQHRAGEHPRVGAVRLLQVIDLHWREHLYAMDYLREGIHLRALAQLDPLSAYRTKGHRDVRRDDGHDPSGVRAVHLPRRDDPARGAKSHPAGARRLQQAISNGRKQGCCF